MHVHLPYRYPKGIDDLRSLVWLPSCHDQTQDDIELRPTNQHVTASLVYFFCSRQMLPPQWVAWSRVYRSSFGISNSQGPSSLDLISLSPFDALKGAIQHSWWSIQPLFPSCSLSLMKCTLSIPEQQERNVQTHTSTPKHTTRWQVPGPKRHLSNLCHAILSISSYPVYTYFFRVSPTDSGIENTATNISELQAGTNLQDDTHRASPATWPLCSALWRSQHLRSSQFISSGQSRGSLGSQGPSGCRCSARDSMMWRIKRHRSIDLMRLKHSEFSLDGRTCIGLYWMAMYYIYVLVCLPGLCSFRGWALSSATSNRC